MSSIGTERRLAAIVFTDIAGYTLMMQRDEAAAMDAVRKHHTILEQCVPLNNGVIQQYFGDGSLTIFGSATDAVQCAMQLQEAFLEKPEVPVRIGIHIGEIRSEGGKVFGDGVNVASRIESIGQPGAVLFSRDVYEKVRNHTEFNIEKLGKYEFKNVDDPIEVYCLTNEGLRKPDPNKIEGKLKEQKQQGRKRLVLYMVGLLVAVLATIGLLFFPRDGMTSTDLYRSSIAVLPFEDLSQNQDESFFSIGIAEDILTKLAQVRELKVIARESSMRFADDELKGMSHKQIAKELGVDNLLMGSLRRYGDVLKITTRLVDAQNGTIIWAEEFTGPFEDILNLQQSIAVTVANRLKVRLSPEMERRLGDKGLVNPEAYELYMRGREALLKSSGSPPEVQRAISYFEQAIEVDSTLAKAWVGLADAHLESIFWHRTTDGLALPVATQAAVKALKLDPDLGGAYAALGAIDLYSNHITEAEVSLTRALELNPNCSYANERLAWTNFFSGRDKVAFEYLNKAIELDPLSTRHQGALANGYYVTHRFDEGIEIAKTFLEKDPDNNFLLWALAYLYAGKGDCEKSIATLDKRTIGRKTNWVYAYCYDKLGMAPEAREILDTLIARDNRGFVPDFMMAVAYAANNEKDNAIERLEHATAIGGESFFAWGLSRDPMFDKLRDDPRFQKINERIANMYGQ